jgi:glycine/D-amino acid oxidase-like deaminating enzyme
LKSSFDVAVVGSGLAGLLVADALADHCDVIRIEGGGTPAPASHRSMGIVARGGMDSPARLKLALPDQAESIWRWSGRAVGRLLDQAEALGVAVDRAGTYRVSLGEPEWREWQTSARLLEQWGVDSRELSSAEVETEGLGCGFDGAVWIGGEGQVALGSLLDALEAKLHGRAEVRTGTARVDKTLGGVTLQTADGAVHAEVAILAAGANSRSVHPWFKPMVFPVRVQSLHIPGARLPGPALVRHRFEAWTSDAAGVGFVGCRWAEQPEMEAGVTDDGSVSDLVIERSREFLGRHHPDLDLAGARASAGITAFSCDGLPLVGPLPGEPRVHALCGWGGWGLSWIGAAAEDVAAAVLGSGTVDAIPAALRPRRMV